MSDPQAFRFRPALLRSAQDWVLDGRDLRGPYERFNLDLVTETLFAEMGVRRGGVIRRLDLIHPQGKLSISVTGIASDRNVRAHADLVGAILARLAERDENLPLVIGERGAPRLTMFLAGLFSLLAAAGLGIAVAVGNGRTNAEVFLSLGVLAVFGLVVSARYRPWAALPRLTVGIAPALIAALKSPR